MAAFPPRPEPLLAFVPLGHVPGALALPCAVEAVWMFVVEDDGAPPDGIAAVEAVAAAAAAVVVAEAFVVGAVVAAVEKVLPCGVPWQRNPCLWDDQHRLVPAEQRREEPERVVAAPGPEWAGVHVHSWQQNPCLWDEKERLPLRVE